MIRGTDYDVFRFGLRCGEDQPQDPWAVVEDRVVIQMPPECRDGETGANARRIVLGILAALQMEFERAAPFDRGVLDEIIDVRPVAGESGPPRDCIVPQTRQRAG